MVENGASRLVLGTAQLGMPYGINNRRGQPSALDALEIVREAWCGGIVEFDTAQTYGISEQILGKTFVDLGIENEAKTLTKMDPQLDLSDRGALEECLEKSLERLRVKKIFGLMLHHENQLNYWNDTFREWLNEKHCSGLIGSFGVSLYTPSKALEALKMDEIQFLQIPTNICDRRFEEAGVFTLAEANHKTIYIRSIYLQGLLLKPPEDVPDFMRFALKTIHKVRSLAQEMSLSVEELCLGYVIERWPKSRIIFGVETKEQVLQNLSFCGKDFPLSAIKKIEGELMNCEEHLVDARQWPTRGCS